MTSAQLETYGPFLPLSVHPAEAFIEAMLDGESTAAAAETAAAAAETAAETAAAETAETAAETAAEMTQAVAETAERQRRSEVYRARFERMISFYGSENNIPTDAPSVTS